MSKQSTNKPIPVPNFTALANEFTDDYMCKLSGSATKVYIAISRKTIGWHKETDYIAISQMMELTGLSNKSVIKAITELEKEGLVEKVRSGSINRYTLHFAESEQKSPPQQQSEEITQAECKKYTPQNELSSHTKETHTKETQTNNNDVVSKKEQVKEDPVDVSMEFLTTIGLTNNFPLREKVKEAIKNGIAAEDMGDFFHYLLSLARGKDNPRGWAISQLPVSEHVHKFRASVEPVPTKEIKTIFDEPLEEEEPPATPEQAKEYFDKLHEKLKKPDKVLTFPDNSNDKLEEAEKSAIGLF